MKLMKALVVFWLLIVPIGLAVLFIGPMFATLPPEDRSEIKAWERLTPVDSCDSACSDDIDALLADRAARP